MRRWIARVPGIVRRALILYLIVVGVVVHVVLAGATLVVWNRYGFAAAARKAVNLTESTMPYRAGIVRRLVEMIGIEVPGQTPGDAIRFPDMSAWSGRGASPDSERSDEAGIEPARRNVEVATEADLRRAIATATAGDVITLAPGTYRIADRNVSVDPSGEPGAPIVVRSRRLGEVVIEFDALEGFLVHGSYWHFENLEIHGICSRHSDCEHAFHIVGEAQGTVVRNNILRDFNAAIKGNGLEVHGTRVFPDDVVIASNSIYNTTVRQTDNAVTPIDVVGANGWIVRGNLIADFAKGEGDRISYAAFFKGNSAHGIFEDNLVICEMHVLDPATTRLGLSLGGGGSAGSPLCRDDTCVPEHTDGVIRNNIILHCNDLGIYLNRAAHALVLHNTIYDTAGIDIQFAESRAVVANNLLSGEIRDRRGGESTRSHNLTGVRASTFRKWFVDPDRADFRASDVARLVDQGDPAEGVVDDFCGARRTDGRPDIGAIEYSAEGGGCDPSRNPR